MAWLWLPLAMANDRIKMTMKLLSKILDVLSPKYSLYHVIILICLLAIFSIYVSICSGNEHRIINNCIKQDSLYQIDVDKPKEFETGSLPKCFNDKTKNDLNENY